MNNPWKKISSKIVHKNAWFKINQHKVIRPDGKEGEYNIVESGDSVLVVPYAGDDKFYLVGQWRFTIDQYSWEFPSGRIDLGEDSLTAAIREFLEETGCEAKDFKYIGKCSKGIGHENAFCHLYIATDIKKVTDKTDAIEQTTVREVAMTDIEKMIKENEIVDDLTIVGFYKFLIYKRGGEVR